MSKSSILGLLVFLTAVIVSVVAAWFYFGTANTSQKAGTLTTTFAPAKQTQTTKPGSAVTVNLPVNPLNEGVLWTSLTYGFRGRIVGLTPTSKGTQILLSITTVMPRLIATKNTKVFVKEGETQRATTSNGLKVGQTVELSTTYSLKSDTWSVNSVTIVSSAPPTTPTASAK